jgi:alkylmercury lyase-like protein
MDFDTRLRSAIYRHFAGTGQGPALGDMAAECGCSDADVLAGYARLQANRVLLLSPDGDTVRMAPPFSGVPTIHTVEVDQRTYFANCAWDALGIPAALHEEAVVQSTCGQSSALLRLRAGLDGPEPSQWLFHCQVPAARWWENLAFT